MANGTNGAAAGPRPIHVIAGDIYKAWGPKVNFAAKPYLSAMLSMNSAKDDYGADSGTSIILYFLSNARTFTGPAAKALKAELKAALKG